MKFCCEIAFVFLLASSPAILHAQAPDPTAPATDVALTAALPDAEISDYSLPPDKFEKAQALYQTRLIMYVIDAVYAVAVLVLVLWFRVSATFRDWAERASRRRFVQAIIFAPLLLILIDLLTLPLTAYGHHLQQSYGLSVQSWGSWFWDWTKGEIIGTVIATLLVWGLYSILRRSPERWWFYGWLASIPAVLLLVFIQPMFIAPLFNKFDSLESKQPQLIPELEKVMHRGGLDIDRSRMFEMQASDKVTTYNAYVSGIGASKRVVVWDNTSRDMTIPETLFVFGHEQGHYVLHHIWMSLVFLIVGFLIALYLAYRFVGSVLSRWAQRWGVRDVGDWASLPVLLLMFSAFSLLSQPVGAGFSRYLEHQADIYGLEVIHGLVPDSPQVAAHAFQKLGEKGLAYPDPNPLFVMWAFDHPPIADRIRFAAQYQPWNDKQPTRYIDPVSRERSPMRLEDLR
jgi:Zn-dependent protease with chaperone function